MCTNKIRPSDEAIRKLAEERKQADDEYIKKLQQIFRSIPGVNVQVSGLDTLASKPIEEYEESIRKQIDSLFCGKNSA